MSVDELRRLFHGTILEPHEEDYDDARIVWNGMIDRRPALIARCCNAADVAAGIAHARREGFVIAVHGGGHNVAGYAVCDGGLMIDLSSMNSVRVSPDLDRVFVGGGATWGAVDAATTPFGRATPGGLISTTGVAGLTLSGGIGWLRGTHGLSCDNLLSADLVTAEGKLIRASADENPDLLWALKGGGGNFGVVVTFKFALHPIAREIMFCAPLYPEERATEILPLWRDYMASAPDEVSGLAEFSTIPNDTAYPEHLWGRRVVALATVYDGPSDVGERIMMPLRTFGEPMLDFSERMSYRTLQTLYDGLFPKGRDRCYWKSTYLTSMDEATIASITRGLAARPSDMTFASIWSFGGQFRRVAAEATAFGDRSMPFMLSLDAIWSNAGEDDRNISWAKAVWSEMQRHSNGRMYLNFPGHGEDIGLARKGFTPLAFQQLQRVKQKFDPANIFRMNQNIVPAGWSS